MREPTRETVTPVRRVELRLLGNGQSGRQRWRNFTGALLVQGLALTLLLILPLWFVESLPEIPGSRVGQPPLVFDVYVASPGGAHTQGGTHTPELHVDLGREPVQPSLELPETALRYGEPTAHTDTELATAGLGGPLSGGQVPGLPGGAGSGFGESWFGSGAGPERPQPPVVVGGRVRQPRLLQRVEPKYPELAAQARIEGDVLLEAIIGLDGRVEQIQVLAGHPALAQAAMEAVRQWRYAPTYLNDRPVAVRLHIRVHFHLRQ